MCSGPVSVERAIGQLSKTVAGIDFRKVREFVIADRNSHLLKQHRNITEAVGVRLVFLAYIRPFDMGHRELRGCRRRRRWNDAGQVQRWVPAAERIGAVAVGVRDRFLEFVVFLVAAVG